MTRKTKGTGIYNVHGFEVLKKDIDHWCDECQFPFEGERCRSKDAIQKCWRVKTAHEWHMLHECPFFQKGLSCRCDEFSSVKDAFAVAGVPYRKQKMKQ